MNIENLKVKFPNYKITDASNRTNDEIVKISSICCLKKNILVVIERNSKNDDYFYCIETIEGLYHGDMKYIILNEDNYYFNSSLSNSFVLHYTSNENLMEKINVRFVWNNATTNI